jgi:hypothetical protein
MILLNQPWSVYERQLATHQRRQSRDRAIACAIYCTACILLGLGIGILFCH